MQHSQSDVALGTNGSWADLKVAEGLKKRCNTAQNLQFYGTLAIITLSNHSLNKRQMRCLIVIVSSVIYPRPVLT